MLCGRPPRLTESCHPGSAGCFILQRLPSAMTSPFSVRSLVSFPLLYLPAIKSPIHVPSSFLFSSFMTASLEIPYSHVKTDTSMLITECHVSHTDSEWKAQVICTSYKDLYSVGLPSPLRAWHKNPELTVFYPKVAVFFPHLTLSRTWGILCIPVEEHISGIQLTH